MDISRFRKSSGGLFTRRSSQQEITPETNEPSAQSLASSLTDGSLRNSPPQEQEDKLFVAVGKEFMESRSVLLWALRNPPRTKKFVLVHVHRPAKSIPMMGGMFPISMASEEEVNSYRQEEIKNMNTSLSQYLDVCAGAKVESETLVIEMDDVAKGLLALIQEHRIRNLVVGAAADRHYSRRMRSPRSQKVRAVQKKAPSFCRLSFVCDGNLVCVRETDLPDSLSPLPSATASPRSLGSGSTGENWSQESVRGAATTVGSPSDIPLSANISVDIQREEPVRMDSMITQGETETETGFENAPSSFGSPSESMDPSELDDVTESMYPSELEEIYSKLQKALEDAHSAKNEAYEESGKRMKAEKDALEAAQRVSMLECQHARERTLRRQAEEALNKLRTSNLDASQKLWEANQQKSALEVQLARSMMLEDMHERESRQRRETEKELDKLRAENLETAQNLWEANEQKSALEAQLAQLHQNLVEAQLLVDSLQKENQELNVSSSSFSVFTYKELDRATCGFDSALKIGEGGYGTVYKGTLRHTTVAIKRLRSHGIQGQKEFRHEVEVLRRVRHPNLVTLIGVCPEAWCLVYEYLPSGSLEDRLTCKDDSPPLPWVARLRVMADICSALMFLHSSEPHSIIHGDLKPANILLDASFVSKLGDFGLSRLLSHHCSSSSSSSYSFLCHHTENPKGTLEYMDPEILVAGELTVGSDVYSFGIIILRLLTGLPPKRIARTVEEAMENVTTFNAILDHSGGSWPFNHAKQLARLALKCCAMTHKARPDMANGVWKILQPMLNLTFTRPELPLLPYHHSVDESNAPVHFLCPIFQEIMIDPQVAADGYTYEGEALKGWFEGGNHTSPMTNLVLPHQKLIPNHALRCMIQEWLQFQRQRNNTKS